MQEETHKNENLGTQIQEGTQQITQQRNDVDNKMTELREPELALARGGYQSQDLGCLREVCGPICGLDQLGQRVQKVECLMNSLHSSVIRMGEKVEEIELDVKTTITCRVCYKHAPIEGVSHVNVFGCGHCFCSVHMCAFSMTNCATCRAPIVGKFKLFL